MSASLPAERPPLQLNPLAPGKPSPSYSQLLGDLRAGLVKDLELSLRQREVRVRFDDGRQATVPVFSNDQLLLRTAEAAKVPLTVRDDRSDGAAAGLVANGLLVLLLLGGAGPVDPPLGPGGQPGHGIRQQQAQVAGRGRCDGAL